MQDYNFEIVHTPGKINSVPVALSRGTEKRVDKRRIVTAITIALRKADDNDKLTGDVVIVMQLTETLQVTEEEVKEKTSKVFYGKRTVATRMPRWRRGRGTRWNYYDQEAK